MSADPQFETKECWTCPGCAFSFAREHVTQSGGYSCPCCGEAAALERITALEAKCDLYAASLKKSDARVAALEEGLRYSTELLVQAGCFTNGESAPRPGCVCPTCLQVADNRALLATAEKDL